MIRGRVVSTERVSDIVLLSEGSRIGQLTFGQAEAVSSITLPDGAAAMRRNFVFQLPSQHDVDATRIAFSVIVRADGDRGAQSDFEIEIDPADPARARVASGPVEAGVTATGTVPAVILYAESATVDTDGNLRVRGWAVSQEMLVGIRISVDDNLVGAAVLGGVREDVANIHKSYPNARNSGFSLSAPIGDLAGDASRIRIHATTLAGSSVETMMPIEAVARPEVVVPVPAAAPPPRQSEPPRAESPSDPRREISLYCDELSLGTDGILWVRGWAVCAVGIAGISVLLDDKPLGDAEIGQPRLDVGDAYRDVPAARFSGFRMKVKAGGQRGGDACRHRRRPQRPRRCEASSSGRRRATGQSGGGRGKAAYRAGISPIAAGCASLEDVRVQARHAGGDSRGDQSVGDRPPQPRRLGPGAKRDRGHRGLSR